MLLKDADKLKNSEPYRFDVIDVQRQMMTNMGQVIHKRAAEAFLNRDKEAFALHSKRFLQMLEDVDELLRTRPEFNFDRWLTSARSWGDTEEEKNLLEYDATSLVTIWGADGDPSIFDYSWREWTGLIKGYYLPRWTKFYAMLQEHLDNGTTYSEEGLRQTHGRTPIVQGDEIEIAGRMYKKYTALAKEYYQDFKADAIKDGKTYENLGE